MNTPLIAAFVRHAPEDEIVAIITECKAARGQCCPQSSVENEGGCANNKKRPREEEEGGPTPSSAPFDLNGVRLGYNDTALHLAAERGFIRAVRALLLEPAPAEAGICGDGEEKESTCKEAGVSSTSLCGHRRACAPHCRFLCACACERARISGCARPLSAVACPRAVLRESPTGKTEVCGATVPCFESGEGKEGGCSGLFLSYEPSFIPCGQRIDRSVNVHLRAGNGDKTVLLTVCDSALPPVVAHEMASLLIAAGADVNCRAQALGRTPLHFAALGAKTRVMLALLAAGADPTVPDACGTVPLHIACNYKVAENAELFAAPLTRYPLLVPTCDGASDGSSDVAGSTSAARLGMRLIAPAVGAGAAATALPQQVPIADINAADSTNVFPLLAALRGGSPNVLRILLHYGGARRVCRVTPVQAAAAGERERAGATADGTDTVRGEASEEGEEGKGFRLPSGCGTICRHHDRECIGVHSADAECPAPPPHPRTDAIIANGDASSSSSSAVVRSDLPSRKSIDLTIRNCRGQTALHVAVQSAFGTTEALSLLLAAGCDPRLVDSAGATPLEGMGHFLSYDPALRDAVRALVESHLASHPSQ